MNVSKKELIFLTPMLNYFWVDFVEITLWHGCSPVNLLHIFRIPYPKNTSGGLFLAKLTNNKFSVN